MKNKRESVHRLPLGTLLVFWLSCNQDIEGSLVSAIPTGLVSIPVPFQVFMWSKKDNLHRVSR